MSERRTRTPWVRAGLLLGGTALGVGIACIIPDDEIKVLISNINDYPVRFVEGIPLDEAARCACSSESCQCPLPSFTGLPTYLDPEDPAYQFCICSENKVDEGRLYGGSLFVEDQDEVDGAPSDSLYAAALLDWNPTLGESAFEYVAYRNYLDPRKALDLYYSSYESSVIKRPTPYVRSITLSDVTSRFDLCNDAGRPLEPGFHTLSVIVTDRMWFEREGEIIGETGGDGDPIETMATTLDGVPDIAAGATYDIQTFVFMCRSEGDDKCFCVEQSEG